MYSFIFCLISINSIFSAGQARLISAKPCVTSEGGIDLNPLIRPSSNYKFVVGDLEFHINICRPLVKKDGEYCPDDAAVCMFKRKNGQLSDPVSLGLANDSPTLASDGIVDLIYESGSVCEENKEQKIRTKLSFWCEPYGGNAMDHHYENCTHVFDWKTAVACGEINDISKRENRSVIQLARDFPSLSFLNELHCAGIFASMPPDDYILKFGVIDFCGHRWCAGGFICIGVPTPEIVHGYAVNIVTDDSSNSIRMDFTRGSTCNSNGYRKAQSSITFICEDDGDDGLWYPDLVKDEVCNLEFELRTPKVCQSQTENSSTVTPRSSLSSKNHLQMQSQTENANTVMHQSSESSTLSGLHIACIGLAVGLTLLAIIHHIVKRLNLIPLLKDHLKTFNKDKLATVNLIESS